MAKIHWSSLLIGAVLGAAGLYIWQNHGRLGIFVDRMNPNDAYIEGGGGHSFGGNAHTL